VTGGAAASEAAYVTLWRIASDTPDFTADDLSGKGAELSGGRWNRPGTPLVYASSSRALACLESIAHLGAGDLPLNRYLVEIRVPATAWRDRDVMDPAAHVGWDAEPAGKVSLDWGTAWAAARTALLGAVPSVIVPEESNILVNPRHPDVAVARARKIRKWTYDTRLKAAR
jgi:RES domain-containing protein